MTAQPVLVTPSQQENLRWIRGSEHSIVLDGDATDGALALLRSTLREGAASPLHVHPGEDETLLVLHGSLVVWAGAARWVLGDGDTVFLPRGIPHTYVAVGDTDLVTVCTPSGMERFFHEAGWDSNAGPAPDSWSPSQEALTQAASRGGQIVLGPPLAPQDSMPSVGLGWSPDGR